MAGRDRPVRAAGHLPGRAAAGRRAVLAAPALLLAPRASAQSAATGWRPGQQVRIIVPAAAKAA